MFRKLRRRMGRGCTTRVTESFGPRCGRFRVILADVVLAEERALGRKRQQGG